MRKRGRAGLGQTQGTRHDRDGFGHRRRGRAGVGFMGGRQFNDLCIDRNRGGDFFGGRCQPLGEQLQTKKTEDNGKGKGDWQPWPEGIVQGQ